jgi:hypothetical protein
MEAFGDPSVFRSTDGELPSDMLIYEGHVALVYWL